MSRKLKEPEQGFLVFTRRFSNNETDIIIEDNIQIRLLKIQGQQVRIGIRSLDGVYREFNRREVWEAKDEKDTNHGG